MHLLQQRQQCVNPRRIELLALLSPVTFMVFDLLYCRRRDLTAVPLVERRRRLTELVADLALDTKCQGLAHPHVLAPLYIVGPGKKLFYEIAKRDLEGVMAKRLDSPYLPGKRSAHWLKIKVRPDSWRIYQVRDEEDDDLWKRDDEDEAGRWRDS